MPGRSGQRLPVSRRHVLATAGAVGSGLVAGCSDVIGGDDGSEDEGNSGSFTADSTVGNLSVEQAVKDDSEYIRGDGKDEWFGIVLTVRNSGDRRTDLHKYNYEMRIYNPDGENVTGDEVTVAPFEETEVEPGETQTISIITPAEGADVARGEVVLNCDGRFTTHIYCEPDQADGSR
jgi:hypothetical protein